MQICARAHIQATHCIHVHTRHYTVQHAAVSQSLPASAHCSNPCFTLCSLCQALHPSLQQPTFCRYESGSLDNLFIHLTNASINKHSPTLLDDKEGVGTGSKWSLDRLMRYLKAQGCNINRLWSR